MTQTQRKTPLATARKWRFSGGAGLRAPLSRAQQLQILKQVAIIFRLADCETDDRIRPVTRPIRPVEVNGDSPSRVENAHRESRQLSPPRMLMSCFAVRRWSRPQTPAERALFAADFRLGTRQTFSALWADVGYTHGLKMLLGQKEQGGRLGRPDQGGMVPRPEISSEDSSFCFLQLPLVSTLRSAVSAAQQKRQGTLSHNTSGMPLSGAGSP